MMRTSVCEPQQQIQGIVVGGIASDPIVVGAAAVELGVADVLRRQFDVEPRQIVDLGEPAAGIRRPARARDDAGPTGWSRRIQSGVYTPGGREETEGGTEAAGVG